MAEQAALYPSLMSVVEYAMYLCDETDNQNQPTGGSGNSVLKKKTMF